MQHTPSDPLASLKDAGVHLIDGPTGVLEVIVDTPRGERVGTAVMAHPHPLVGGSATHKIPDFLARAVSAAGWRVVRPNFRGVGRSAGAHDEGRGECDDLLSLAQALQRGDPAPLALVGFSFGAFVQACVARRLADAGRPAARAVLLGLPFGEAAGGRSYDTAAGIPNALVVHGENDDSVPLASVFEWARRAAQPVVVVPAADHFFTGQLPLLRQLVLSHLRI